METDGTSEGAFLDIATNLLAIILILTLFSLVSIQQERRTSTSPTARPTSLERFVEPQRDLFPPFSVFYFVLSERVVRWDQEAVVEALSAAPDLTSGSTAQGRYQWLPEPLVTRDLDTFQLRFFLDQAAVQRQEPAFPESRIDAFIAELTAAHTANRAAPVFLVYPDGMETFAPLYERLQQSDLRFRWFTQAVDAPLLLGRHPAQFTDHGIYW
ncbi:hypothetical protein G3480_12005 [Thiorhodococcus mannitoliphagus]|uniref:Uncharacterized protein n=1 Tax=Thiorhodococcus mannitoliphagus TaxID=329406 RepID=A0A6P1DWE0_9GAMM|nr:hypothetical protein [Thiorhodococcus mannitoliphagus]NEX21026.1 hypothetical protein [Thiorhodococcus mannitoliphagus]